MGEVLSVAAPPPDPVNNNTWWDKAKSMAGAKPEQKGGMEQVFGFQLDCHVSHPGAGSAERCCGNGRRST